MRFAEAPPPQSDESDDEEDWDDWHLALEEEVDDGFDQGLLDIWNEQVEETYVPAPSEYVAPPVPLHLVDRTEANKIPAYTNQSYAEIPCWWTHVRGTGYKRSDLWHYSANEESPVLYELVPLPGNPHDHCAVGVYLDGIHFGYVPSTYAEHAHWRIRQLNALGFQVFTVGDFDYGSTWPLGFSTPTGNIAVPTLQTYDQHLPPLNVQMQLFTPLWDALSDNDRGRIKNLGFDLDDELVAQLISLKSASPRYGLPTLPFSEAMPFSADLFLRDARHADYLEEQARIEALHQEIGQHLLNGGTRSSAAQAFGVTTYRVKKAIETLGLQVPRAAQNAKQHSGNIQLKLSQSGSTQNLSERGKLIRDKRNQIRERAQRNSHALDLQRQGLTYRAIAASLGLGESGIGQRLRDARFIEDPGTDPGRLMLAAQAKDLGLRKSAAESAIEARAITDALVLDVLAPGWQDKVTD